MIFVSASGTRQRSNYWAGVVIVVLAAICLMLMARISHNRKNPSNMIEYSVVFNLSSGVNGVSPGSLVYYGGIEVGIIEGVAYKNGTLTVKTLVQNKFRLHPGAMIIRSESLIGGQASFVIVSTGNKDKSPLPNGASIMAAKNEDGARKIVGQENADHLKRIRDAISRFEDDYGDVSMSLDGFRDTRNEIEQFTAEVRSDVETWTPTMETMQTRLDSIGPRVSTAGEDLAGVNESAGRMIEDVDRLRLLFTDERFETLKNDLELAMTNYESLSSTFNEEIVPKTKSIMKAIEDSEARGKQTLAELQRMAGEGRGTMQIFVANSTLAAQELILAQDEILSTLGLSLLERPTQLDLELMIREEALEMWARTATRIHLLLGAVESLDIDSDESKRAEEILQRLRGELQKTLDDYLAVQKRIFNTAEPPDPEDR